MAIMVHRFSGTLPAGDIFNFSWHSNTANAVVASNAAAVAWANSFWVSGLGPLKFDTWTSTATELTKVTTYELNPVAPYHTVAIAEADVALAGVSVNASLPQDISEVVTLRTIDPSRAGRGRFYLPPVTGGELATNGELSPAIVNDIVAALLAAWTGSAAAGEHPCVFSRSTGIAKAVTRFGMGTVLDIQQRRVNKVNTVRSFDAMP